MFANKPTGEIMLDQKIVDWDYDNCKIVAFKVGREYFVLVRFPYKDLVTLPDANLWGFHCRRLELANKRQLLAFGRSFFPVKRHPEIKQVVAAAIDDPSSGPMQVLFLERVGRQKKISSVPDHGWYWDARIWEKGTWFLFHVNFPKQ